jgi:hypothetical protein
MKAIVQKKENNVEIIFMAEVNYSYKYREEFTI